jgi:hypothetical protein
MGLEAVIERAPRAFAGAALEHDKRFGFEEPLLILGWNYRGFEHIGMARQSSFNFERRNPDAADFEHVIGAAAVRIGAVVPDVFVAGARPLAFEDASAAPARATGSSTTIAKFCSTAMPL